MKTKTSQGDAILILFIILLLIYGLFQSIPTSHNNCVDMCEDIYSENFEYKLLQVMATCKMWLDKLREKGVSK